MSKHDLSRRTLFASGALALAAAGLAQTAAAATPPSPTEAANLKLVQDFCATWGARDFDPAVVMPAYLATDASVRVMDSMPFVVGPAAVVETFRPFLQNGERFAVKFLSSFAKGPLVVTHRIDTVLTPGKPDQDVEVVGVFLVRNGKIKEWTDYLVA